MQKQKEKFIVIHPDDNVATALVQAESCEKVTIEIEGKSIFSVKLIDMVRPGHKIAIRPICNGESVIKYGFAIGKATEDISAGAHVHTHNVESNRGRGDLKGK